jgi:phosphoglycerate dehydrogenase-like enzyme/sugar (pentulose or hexulose) kinase/ribulose-5-phosphate 4-epimerase/fuculose-1-phosphate aldolase
MNKTYFMGIDIGGGGVRCLLVSAEDASCVSALRTWSFPPEAHASGLAFGIDLDTTWDLIGEACREAVAAAGISGEQIAGVAVSAIRFGTVIIDKGGRPIFAAPNRDARAVVESAEIAAECGDELNRATGMWPSALHLPARLRMLQKTRPEVLEQAACIFSLGDWVNFKLCGVRVTDFSQAGVTQLFELAAREWDVTQIERLGLSPDLFPPVLASGSALGMVSPQAAAHLGLSAATLVGLGGGDSQCSMLGTGAIRPGALVCVAGTTAPVMVVSDRPIIDDQGRTWSGHHVVPGLFVLESSGGTMGETLTFIARLLFPEAPEPELRLLAEAAQSEYGAKGMVSTFGADVMDFRNPQIPAGQITLSHLTCADDVNPRSHLCRAVVEGYACALRENIAALGAITGESYQEFYLSAGMSRSAFFAQVLANVTDGSVTRAGQPMSSTLGAALCASVATGAFEDMAGAVAALVRNHAPLACDPAHRDAAQKSYEDWAAIRAAGATGMAAQVNDHVRSRLQSARAGLTGHAPLAPTKVSALVTSGLDPHSLATLRKLMDTEYASVRETRKILRGDDLVAALHGRQVFVTEVDIVAAEVLNQLPDLRVVVACRGNAVNVDVEACTAFGIPVLFTPGRNAVAVADLTVGFMLALARNLVPAAQFLKHPEATAGNAAILAKAYTCLQGRELWHKTIGLVGLGAVGRMVAQRLQGFGTRLIAADPYATPEEAALAGVELVSFERLLAESDVVSLHAAVTAATHNMFGPAQFAAMKPGACFINTARAQLVDEIALLEALDSGTLAGAALDTFLEEPPGFDHPLVQHRNVISTPHIAGNTVEVAEHQGADVCAALERLLHGETQVACLNPQVLAQFDWARPRKQPSASELNALLKRPAPGVSDLQRDQNAGIKHRGVRDAKAASTPAQVKEPEAPAPDQRRELLDTVNELYQQQIITATGGNVAVRCEDNPQHCWITPGSIFKGDLRPDLMVRITLDGEKLDPASPSPSSEWPFHTKTLKKKPGANAVIHAHAPNATILANCGLPFLPISSEAAFFGDITRIPYTMPGSDELAELVSEGLKSEWVVLMVNHGIVVAGTSLRRAADMVQIIERTAEVILGCYQATGGKPPSVLPQKAVDLMRSYADFIA